MNSENVMYLSLPQPLVWDELAPKMREFREKRIMPTIVATEVEEKAMLEWLDCRLYCHWSAYKLEESDDQEEDSDVSLFFFFFERLGRVGYFVLYIIVALCMTLLET